MQFNKLMTVMVVSSALVLSGCSAMGTAIKKRNLGKNPDERNNLAGTFK
ncbi:conjugal transfer surface exclusion protein TraT [Klebsiella pneumoniae]|nr:conjugal transfer surface exclusion protein TraT [Klebsiella pneumoniae]HBT3459194.1 traT complement resistance domain protein [Klebsiella pneumoniae]HBX2177491.1 traT complement resistance domain protein [Klebsiella pneumoniae]HBX2315211.1 traT complement resistance domain protein [Klebsiella pneumoniae]HBX2364825.1 traT complement resistance domain protein [Klebsiella pneumoniae]